MNEFILEEGFINLDFLGNLGVRGSRYGYKRENNYFFDQVILKEL